MKHLKKEKFKKGFGILEVLVSAVIIIIILTALVFVGKTALANSVYTQQRAQATFLVQEGIEQVRQIRDTNWIDSSNLTQWNSLAWVSGNRSPITIEGNYKLDSNFPNRLISPSSPPEEITINSTVYHRTINISPIAASTILPNNLSDVAINATSNALKIKVEVSFDSTTGNKTISASEVITNWRPNF